MRLRDFLRLPAIINPLPNTILAGQPVSAAPVQQNFDWIVSQVNANSGNVFQTGLQPFTPFLSFGGGSTGITYSTQAGSYTKIGTVIFFTVDIRLSAKGSSTGVAKVGGLPATVNALWASFAGPTVTTEGVTINSKYLAAGFNAGATTIQFYDVASATIFGVPDDTAFTNTSFVSLCGFYSV